MASSHGAKVTLARIVRPRGVKGEVAAEILTDFPERLTKLREVWLAAPAQPRGGSSAAAAGDRLARVRHCWISPSRGVQAIFHFEGCDSIPQAQALVGCEVQVPMEARAKLPSGKHYVSDLVGCEVLERPRGAGQPEPLGTVRDISFTGGAPLLVVESPTGEILIPMVEGICTRVDPAARRIEVVLPEGLRDLNR